MLCSGLPARATMGEYVLYYKGKIVGGIYDNRLLVKNISSAIELKPEASLELLSKIIIKDIER